MASGQGLNGNAHQSHGEHNHNRSHTQHQNYNHNHHYQNYHENNDYTHGQGQGYGHGDSLAANFNDNNINHLNNGRSINGNNNDMPIFYRHSTDYQPELQAGRNLNTTSSVYNLRSWTGWQRQRQQMQDQRLKLQLELAQERQQELQLELEQQQQQLQGQLHGELQGQQQEQHLGSLLHFEMQPLPTTRSHQLNVSAPSFTPASARGGAAAGAGIGVGTGGGGAGDTTPVRRAQLHQIMPSQSQPQLHTPTFRCISEPRNNNTNNSGRRLQLPDLFQTVLKLMRELNRSVSYPEMIGMLSMRMQRLPVELKRQLPHTLHNAVANGYLRKDGNYYTLLSEQEQKVIMKRNQEAAKRAKELEKQPLSWRIR